jgi:hypothetical protein
MTAGGRHTRSKVGVAKGIGWKEAGNLWYRTVTKLSPNADFRTAAEMQVKEAFGRGPDVLHAVACAWYAVGVFRELPRPAAHLVCPDLSVRGVQAEEPSKGPGCAGRSSGFVCSENVPNTALKCRDGVVVSAAFCADRQGKCKKAAADDWTATVNAEGSLACE